MQPRHQLSGGCCTSAPEACPSPLALTRLIGRERDLRELESIGEANRLVTLTGVGGTGKTRLAAELALRAGRAGERRSAVWVDLACVSDPLLVPQQVAAALSLRQVTERPALEAVMEALAEADLLLVLDNCEHLVDACAALAQPLLRHCDQLRILATSREPLGVAGEQVWPVSALSLPSDADTDWNDIARAESVQLFVDRARAANPSFALDANNALAVAEICRSLDGIPLAIELAAARSRLMSAEQIASRLEDQLAILSGGARSSAARHRTLRAAIDWSFALLSPREQSLLARLSVFSGSFSLEAAEAVCSDEVIDRASVLDLLAGLVDKSLVVSSLHGPAVRYYLLKTIRQYAAEKLPPGEHPRIRRRHALACLDLAREALPELLDGSVSRLDRLDPDHPNVCAALEWSIEHEPDAIALPLAAAFRWYWYYRISWSEGLRWMRRLLERTTPSETTSYAGVLSGAGCFALYLGDLSSSRRWLEQGAAIWRATGDERQLALTLSVLAHVLASSNDLDEAARLADEAVSLARNSGSSYNVVYCLANASSFVAQLRGDPALADQFLEEAQNRSADLNHPLGLPLVLNARALLALRRGDQGAARTFASAGLRAARESRELWFVARALRILAATSRSDPQRAARLTGAADGMLRRIAATMLLYERAEHECLMATLREALPEQTLSALLDEGRRLSLDEACDLALQPVSRATAPIVEEQVPPGVLRVSDLGPLQISIDGRQIGAEGRSSSRARELLVFLLAHPEGCSREEVGVAFWPDASGDQVKNSFHVTLYRLRKMLGIEHAICQEGGRYRFNPDHAAEIDSRIFESGVPAALERVKADGDTSALERLLSLYRGDFLQGEDAGEWCIPIRAHLRQLHQRALFALGESHESRGRYAEAADAYTLLLSRDPFHEAACRQLMVCRARLGARSDSLLIYRRFEERLRDDLSSMPEPETTTLYRRIQRNEAV